MLENLAPRDRPNITRLVMLFEVGRSKQVSQCQMTQIFGVASD